MASSLTTLPNPAKQFQDYVLTNINYWHQQIVLQQADTATLNKAKNRIMEGLSFAFELEAAWPFIYDIIETLSPYMERSGYWDEWQWVLDKATCHAFNTQDFANALVLSTLQARLWQRQHQFQCAIRAYRQTIALARQQNNLVREAQACSNLGFLYIEKGYWYRTEVLCKHALILFKAQAHAHGQAHTLNHLGTLYLNQHRWQEAQSALEEACDIWADMQDRQGLYYGFNNLGLLYIRMKEPHQAFIQLQTALDYGQLIGAETLLGLTYNTMCVAYRLADDLDKAKAYAWRADTIFRRYSDLAGQAQVKDNLGVIYTNLGQWEEAQGYFEESLTGWRNLNHPKGELETLLDMVEAGLAMADTPYTTAHLTTLEQLLTRHQNPAFTYLKARLGTIRSQL